jgi:hypothetical protein
MNYSRHFVRLILIFALLGSLSQSSLRALRPPDLTSALRSFHCKLWVPLDLRTGGSSLDLGLMIGTRPCASSYRFMSAIRANFARSSLTSLAMRNSTIRTATSPMPDSDRSARHATLGSGELHYGSASS